MGFVLGTTLVTEAAGCTRSELHGKGSQISSTLSYCPEGNENGVFVRPPLPCVMNSVIGARGLSIELAHCTTELFNQSNLSIATMTSSSDAYIWNSKL